MAVDATRRQLFPQVTGHISLFPNGAAHVEDPPAWRHVCGNTRRERQVRSAGEGAAEDVNGTGTTGEELVNKGIRTRAHT